MRFAAECGVCGALVSYTDFPDHLSNCAPVDPPSGSPVTDGGGTLPGDQT